MEGSAQASDPGQGTRSGIGREWLAVGALIAFGFALRVIFVLAMEAHPTHRAPILDSAFHVDWARAIAAGREYAPLAGQPFFRAPLYVWFLAGIFALFGDGLLLARLVQCGLGAATIGLVYVVGRRAFEPRAAFVAAAIAATYWLLIYFDGELLSETLVVPLVLFALWLTLALASRSSPLRAAATGFAWGVAALARPNVLLFVPLAPLWMLWMRRAQISRELVPALLFGIGVLAPILPVTAWNTFVKGDFALIASYGGINLWIGNNPQSNGIDAFVPGSRNGWWEGYYDAISIAESAEGRSLKASEVSRYYSRRAWDFIVHQPERSIPHFAHKLALFWAGEYGNNEPERFVAHRYSWVPYLSIGYAALAPLALLGMIVSRRDAPRLFPLYGCFATYMASLVLFFVSSRYRVPVLPVMMVFAGRALVWTAQRVRAGELRTLGLAGLFVAGFTAWSVTQGPDPDTVEANGYFLLGSAEEARGDHRKAAEHLRRVIELRPRDVDALVKLAWAERADGDRAAAIGHFQHALEVAPLYEPAMEGLLDLASADGRTVEVEQSIAAYLERLKDSRDVSRGEVAYYYRGRIRVERGDRDGARQDFTEALRRNPRSFRAALARGDLDRESEHWADAAASYRRALFALRPLVPSSEDDRAYAGLVDALERQGRRDLACLQARAWQERRPQAQSAKEAAARNCG